MKTLSTDALLVAPRQELIDTIVTKDHTIEQLKSEIDGLNCQLDWLKRQIFGTKSERFIPSNDLQMALDMGIVSSNPIEQPPQVQTITYDRSKTATTESKVGHGRGTMPTHLPFIDVVIEPEEDHTDCVRMGDEISWEYEYEPGSLKVKRYIRPKYAKPFDDGIIVGELPARAVEKGNAGPGLMAQVTIDKYVYHMPLYRQSKKFKNEYNVDFSESWLSDTVKNTAFWIEPVYNAYVKQLLLCDYLQADETPIPVLTTDAKGKTHRGYFWVYYDPLGKRVCFDYRKSRSSEGPKEFLKDFKGTLQVDGYEGYNGTIVSQGLVRAGCMDHVRRRFDKAREYDVARSNYALDTMREWYRVESEAKEENLTLEQRFERRLAQTVPSMIAFGEWLKEQLPQALPKSPIGVAISYALNQWPFFKPFMTNPKVELSNIGVENAIRPVAIGRKNYMFSGSHEAAQRAAMIYSLVSTATMHKIDPFVYIKDILTRLPSLTTSRIKDFLIPNWKPLDK